MGNGESMSKLAGDQEDIEESCDSGRQRSDEMAVELSKEYFRSEKVPNAGGLLYVRFSGSSSGAEPPPSITRETFVKFCHEIRNLIINSHQQKYYLLLFSKGKPIIDREAVEDFFRTCFLLEADMVGSKYNCKAHSPLLTSVPEALAQACIHTAEFINIESLQAWLEKHCPNLIHCSIHRWVMHSLHVPKSEFPRNNRAKQTLVSGGGSATAVANNNNRSDWCTHADDDDSLLHPVLVWLFANTLPSVYTKPSQPKLPSPMRPMGNAFYDPREVLNTLMKFNSGFQWNRLYSTSEHGQSMNRFQHHVFSYRGPTAMLVRTDAEVMLCICIDHEWRERSSRWGGEHCIAMQITPCFKIFEVGEHMMYFNLTTRGFPFGLHVGRNQKSQVLEIDRDLCLATVKKIPYKLESLEVWGCAGEDIRDAQIKQKKWETDQVEKHKKVNLNAVEWKENPDRYLLELAGRPSYSSTFKR